jgi:2-oxoglutarate dehydrogenase E2 component (dihydrolipoamide succinyltransferase)
VEEATITKWFKKVGDTIEEEDILFEIATDKVDSEIPSPIDGVLVKILHEENALVAVGEVVAVIDMDGDATAEPNDDKKETPKDEKAAPMPKPQEQAVAKDQASGDTKQSDKFFSPLVRNIASKEGISIQELESIAGTGANGRVRKQDVLAYLESRTKQPTAPQSKAKPTAVGQPEVKAGAEDEIVAMDRMRKMIADHMVMSKQVSPHVTNFIEADVTNLVLWRNKVKDEFFKREKQKLTFMPVFIEATAKVLKQYPGVNASVSGDNIILRKNVNIGIAVALPTGNLIVPVIKNADQKSILGLTVDLNNLAGRARDNKLDPDDIQGGTFTISNFGSFKNLSGTPIINQPQVAILATGTIEKKPAVIETPTGDVIGIRHKMMLALTYDHRAIDGALAGAFLQSLAEYLGNFDINRMI